MENSVYENEDRGIVKYYRDKYSDFKKNGGEGSNTSDKASIRAQILQRAELERARRSWIDESSRYGYIYLTTNTINGKMYIGQRKSKKFQKFYKGSGVYLSHALEVYGKDCFNAELLFWCFSFDDMNSMEIEFIKEFNASCNFDIFYNISNGGQEWACSQKGENNGFYGKHHSERAKELNRLAHQGVKLKDEHKKKISEGVRNNLAKNPEVKSKISKGIREAYKVHPEYREKISESNRRRWIENRDVMLKSANMQKKKVVCVETGEVFESKRAANDFIKSGSVTDALRSKSRYAGGYHWEYYEETS